MLDNRYLIVCPRQFTNYNNSTDMNLFGNDGFNGKVSNVYYYNYARKAEQSIDLYNKGPFYKDWLQALASKLQGSLSISVSVDVDTNISY